jgi:putative ABC transport system substrate-binding protein
MKRRLFALLSLAALASPHALFAQRKKVWRVGYLSAASPDADRRWVEALRRELSALGYIEGENLVLDLRHTSQRPGRLSEVAAELVRSAPDVLVVYGSQPVAAVQKSGLPIVMTVHADPLGTGLVPSLARPGGNITGLTDGHADLAPKRLEILKDVVPSIKRVAVLFNPTTPHAVRQLKHVQSAAPAMGLSVVPLEVRSPAEVDAALAKAVQARADALFVAPDPTWWVGQHRRLAEFALANRLPTIGTVRQFADQGMLLAYGTNFTELWRRSAVYVDKILKGAKPGDLPIEQATKFDLVINLKTARAIGVSIPAAVALRADYLIQ